MYLVEEFFIDSKEGNRILGLPIYSAINTRCLLSGGIQSIWFQYESYNQIVCFIRVHVIQV